MFSKKKTVLLACASLAMVLAITLAGYSLAQRRQRIHVDRVLQHGTPFDAEFTYSPSFIPRRPDKLLAIKVSIGPRTEIMPTAAFSDLPPLDLKHTPVFGERFEVAELTVWPRAGTSAVTRISWRFQNDELFERVTYTAHGKSVIHYTKPPNLIYFNSHQGLAKVTQP